MSTATVPTALAQIGACLGRHVAFHPRLVALAGSAKAALLLSQMLYWTRHGRDITHRDGWFFKTSSQWQRETGLSVKEQMRVRRALRERGFLAERRIGVPAKLYFRLALDQIAGALAGEGAQRIDWTHPARVADVLGPRVPYQRKLAVIAAGIHAGLLLSRALCLTRMSLPQESEGWILRSAHQWAHELGLTRREFEGARVVLAKALLTEERIAGAPPRLMIRLNLPTLLARLEHTDSSAETAITVLPIPPEQFDPNRHHSLAQSAITDLPKAPQSIYKELQEKNYNAAPKADPSDSGDEVGCELIFPQELLTQECEAARRLLQPFPQIAQALLDELAARMETHAIQTNPITYLRALISHARAGTFVAEAGVRIDRARRRRTEEAERRKAQAEADQRFSTERDTPEFRAKIAKRREDIRRFLDRNRARPWDKPSP
jgi:hypothetical protein